ncbi:MAG: hypothetical protein Ct9H90mP3_3980 [Flammeovirgaceae bacterium]|nr:MAG: hypothetical protein Ct9H90mP3_3980 [Flammeovirgaceae bacterium]
MCQAIIAIPVGGFLSPNSDSVQKTWSLKVQLTILVINASFAALILSDPMVTNNYWSISCYLCFNDVSCYFKNVSW